MRIPKLRGFKNRFKIDYEIVNVGAIGALAERGAFALELPGGTSAMAAPTTINQDILRAVGLVRTLKKPLKILGTGELSTPLFVVADAFTASARRKIEAAGGNVNVLEVPATPLAALGVNPEAEGRVAPKIGKRAAARTAAIARNVALAAATAAAKVERAAAAATKPTKRATAAAKVERAVAGKPARGAAGTKSARPAAASARSQAAPAAPAETAGTTEATGDPAEGEAPSAADA
jgi:hypothetical protein